MNIAIRPMVPADAEQVAELEKKIFSDAWSFEQLLAETNGEFFKHPLIMESNNTIAGYACVWAFSDEVHINNFAVNPDFRRKGLGLKLISFIFDKFRDYKTIFLEVRISNQPAISLYTKSGFEKYFIRKNYYSDGEDAIVMKKSL
ncbi:MAG: ribosomal protein S18-alanine N-acetyltransferase [Calditrichaeota bacterium]|nr:ribosomal protein S18-alanine N-acetyltransferase [Calditrichota bacterium]